MAKKFLMPHSIYTGSGALQDASADLLKMGHHVFIVTDAVMRKLGNLQKLTDIFEANQMPYTVYDEINSEPNDTMIEKGLALYRQSGSDCLVAMGGGSPIDSMKAIAMMDVCGGSLTDRMGKNFDEKRAQMAAIPTTAGTGSECTMFTIINDTQNDVKMLLTGSSLIPDLAIIDPVFTMTAPKSVTAATGIDALCHAVESYTSRKAQPLSETMSLSAIEKIFRYLPVCYDQPENEEARSMMAIAATQAGTAFNNASVTIIHGMSRPIGANFHIAHGLSNAVLIEACLQYVRKPIEGKLAEIARFAHLTTETDDQKAADAFFISLHDLLVHLQIPAMKDIIKDHAKYLSLVDKMAEDAMISGSPANTIQEVTAEDLKKIYRSLIEE
jgi:alcohol dehydrogenase class IV